MSAGHQFRRAALLLFDCAVAIPLSMNEGSPSAKDDAFWR